MPLSGTGSNGEGNSNQYVTFTLNNERYAVEALRVQEIIELTSITPVPHLPDHFKGVINLRGTIIPVIDLKLRFGMPSEEYVRHTCVIIIEFLAGVMGMIVDMVDDVVSLPPEAIAAPPEFGRNVRTEFIRGMGRSGDDLLIILNVERVVNSEDIYPMRDVSPEESSAEEDMDRPDDIAMADEGGMQ